MCLLLFTGLARSQLHPEGNFNFYGNRTKECIDEGIVIYDRNYTNQDLEMLRDSRSNNLREYFQHIFQFIKTRDTGSLMSATGPYGPLLITMMALSFVTLIFLIIWVFGVCRKVHNRCLEEFTVVSSCVIYWAYFGVWVTLLVFTGLAIHYTLRGFCAYLAVPEFFYYGTERITNATNKHMGLLNAAVAIGNFTLESIPYTGTAARDVAYKGIINANLPGSVAGLQTSLRNFYGEYSQARIISADGGLHVSRTINGFIDPYLDPRIEADSKLLSSASLKLHTAAETLLAYGTVNTPASKSLPTLRAQMVMVTREYFIFTGGVAYAWEFFMDRMIRNKNFGYIGVWFTFALTTANALFLGIVMTILFCVCCYRKCLNCVWLAKALLLVVSLFTIGVFIVSLFILFGSVIVSGHCYYLAQINNQFPNSTIIQDVGITMNEPTRIMWRKCIDTNENPSILETTPTTPSNNQYYGDAVKIIDGLTAFPTFERYFPGDQSAGYEETVGNWTRTLRGETLDFNDVDGNLSVLNQAIMCGGTIYAIKPAGCPNWPDFTCLSIYDEGTVVTPSCMATSNITIAQNIFNNLKLYSTSMTNVYTGMISDMSAANPSYGGAQAGPWAEFNKGAALLRAQSSHFAVMRDAFPETTAVANQYNYIFSDLTNCSAVRKELRKTEEVACFKGDYYLYTFLILSIVCGMLLFILEWCICGALREQDNIVYAAPCTSGPLRVIQPVLVSQPVLVGQPFSQPKPTANLYDFDDFEVVPVY